IRSTDSSSFVLVVHRFAKAAGAPSQYTSAIGKWRRYSGEKAPTEKRFSLVDLLESQESESVRNVGRISSSRSADTTSKLAPSRSARRCAWRKSARAEPSKPKFASGTRASSP